MKSRHLSRCLHALVVVFAMVAVGTALYAVAGSVGLQVKRADAAVEWFCLALPVLVLVASAGAIIKRLRYSVVVPLLGVSAAFIVYMVWDDAARPPAPQVDNPVPADSPSYAVYRRLIKDKSDRQVGDDAAQSKISRFPYNLDEWSAFVGEHRAEIEKEWLENPVAQAWFDDMARHPPEGLYPLSRHNDPGLDFSKIRRASQLRWAKFHLYLADGNADEAGHVLLPMLEASYHLQQAGTTLVTQMIAVVMTRGCYQRLNLIAGDPKLSSGARQEIVAVLQKAPPLSLVFSNAFLGEEFVARSVVDALNTNQQAAAAELVKTAMTWGNGEKQVPFLTTFMGRLLFNPRRTEREYSDHLKQSSRLLQAKDFGPAGELAEKYKAQIDKKGIKNPVGRLFNIMSMPAFQKIGKTFWKTEDDRLALIERFNS